MDAIDPDPDAPADILIRCQDSDCAVRFYDRWRPDEDGVHYAIEASAPGLTARIDEAVAGIWGPDLAAFLDELAGDFRGWPGERTWHSLDRDLTINAVFRSGGHVGLTWTLRPWPGKYGGWSASVTTWQEAGEQMTALASDIRAFLHRDAHTQS
jgi:hypothetical protein